MSLAPKNKKVQLIMNRSLSIESPPINLAYELTYVIASKFLINYKCGLSFINDNLHLKFLSLFAQHIFLKYLFILLKSA